MSKIKNIVGNRYARLLVLSFAGKLHHRSTWLCQCDCGNTKIVSSDYLRSQRTKIKSCGCYGIENPSAKKHGEANKTKEYKVWVSMKKRCNDPKTIDFKYWGGKGIKVCERWLDYNNFLADMGRCPTGHSIDRINSNGDYELSNCRWATQVEQQNNRSNNIKFEYNGEIISIVGLAKKLSVPDTAVRSRFYRGWPLGRIVNQPFRKSPIKKN